MECCYVTHTSISLVSSIRAKVHIFVKLYADLHYPYTTNCRAATNENVFQIHPTTVCDTYMTATGLMR